jgi:hypothetical protein
MDFKFMSQNTVGLHSNTLSKDAVMHADLCPVVGLYRVWENGFSVSRSLDVCCWLFFWEASERCASVRDGGAEKWLS